MEGVAERSLLEPADTLVKGAAVGVSVGRQAVVVAAHIVAGGRPGLCIRLAAADPGVPPCSKCFHGKQRERACGNGSSDEIHRRYYNHQPY